MTESFCKHSVNMHVFIRGARACDHWGGKETWPVLRKENPLSKPWVHWLHCWACWAATSKEIRRLHLRAAEPSSFLIVSISPHSQPAHCLFSPKNLFFPLKSEPKDWIGAQNWHISSLLCRLLDRKLTKMGKFHIWATTTPVTFQL